MFMKKLAGHVGVCVLLQVHLIQTEALTVN